MQYYIGIDGGGSKTAGALVAINASYHQPVPAPLHAVAAEQVDKLEDITSTWKTWRAEVGGSNPNSVGRPAASAALSSLFTTLLTNAGISASNGTVCHRYTLPTVSCTLRSVCELTFKSLTCSARSLRWNGWCQSTR
jgi:hypothetical protein